MGGWSITVLRQPPEDYPLRLRRERVLAGWLVGHMGQRWLDRLVEGGQAVRLADGGYPNLYSAPARVIMPLLAGDEPPSDETVGMFKPREVFIRHAELAACPPDEMLTIAVWDQS